MKTVAIIGSTGSIGWNTIDILDKMGDDYSILAVANRSNHSIYEQAYLNAVSAVGMIEHTPIIAEALEEQGIQLITGPDMPEKIASLGADIVVNAMDGSQGIRATMAALEAGSRLALANKESLVCGGELVMNAQQYEGQIIPIDSEHSALMQCLRGGKASEVSRLVITASGGPFRGKTHDELANVDVEQVLCHPTWNMGELITANSASLANKGLEVIEAHHLFNIPFENIDVVVHPQSIVHSMVEFCDGSTMAQLGMPDMRLPIQLALSWPDRCDYKPVTMDWTEMHTLTFEPPDYENFPMLELFINAGKAGGLQPTIATAANEEAVWACLSAELRFTEIAEVVQRTIDKLGNSSVTDISQILIAEEEARMVSQEIISDL